MDNILEETNKNIPLTKQEKHHIIFNFEKNEIMNFFSNDPYKKVLELFDDEGIEILKTYEYAEERIRYFLTYSPHKNEVLKREKFIDVLFDTNISNYYATLNNLDYETYDAIINRAINTNRSPDTISKLLSYFDEEYVIEYLNKTTIPLNLAYEIIISDFSAQIIMHIINKYPIDLTNDHINISRLFGRFKDKNISIIRKEHELGISLPEISLPSNMINRKLTNKIFTTYDIFEVRSIINQAIYFCDPSFINDYVHEMEDSFLNTNKELVEPFYSMYLFYLEYTLLKDRIRIYNEQSDIERWNDVYDELMRLVHIHLDYIEINDKNKVLEKLKELSKKTISNYIIDYHFEENYYNIILDIKELLHFYNEGNVVLEPEHVSIYEQLLNIDNLDFAEAKKLHQLMKKYNMKEIFYDDMRIARQVVKDAIKNYSLSQESIRQYRDEKLSEKYGVDVYFLNGNHFFGIVKTGRYLGDMFPTGHSFSLVGTGGIAVYGNLNDSETFLYDSNSLNPEQIVHVYPYDSYTYFAPFKGLDDSTTRVNTLAMPDEIVSITSSYNEILIYEKGIQPTELDNRIPQLKKIALYCVDRITEKDIEQANKNGVGIILINSNSYIPENPRSLYSYRSRINPGKYDYFDGINDKKEYEMSRR